MLLSALKRLDFDGTPLATERSTTKGPPLMEPFDLNVWLPAMFLLGLLTMGLMFVFVAACEKI
jgi:hypothetical protein